MKLIFGGKYQGKLDYALSANNLTAADVYTCAGESVPPAAAVINDLEAWLYALCLQNRDAFAELRLASQNWENSIVICADVTCGVVPVDYTQRVWREAVGRSLAHLSEKSAEVTRVFCGIATRLK